MTQPTPTPCAGIILAGGLNSRFEGKNKAFIDLGQGPLIDGIYRIFRQVFDEIIIVTNQPLSYLCWDATLVTDVYPMRSSLTGIHAGLYYMSHPFGFVCACDTPFLKKELVMSLISAIEPHLSVVIPETAAGLEPLCAIYAKTCLPLMDRQLQAGHFQIRRMFRKLKVKKIPEPALRAADAELASFFNINTDADFHKAKEWLDRNGD